MTGDPMLAKSDALALSHAALLIDRARQERRTNPEAIVGALNHNVEVWLAIRSIVKNANGSLPEAVKSNLRKLGDFVVGTTMTCGRDIPDHRVETLININLQISAGLLEGQAGLLA
jgi:flagellar protein FlaF